MNKKTYKALYWFPRVLSILFVVFLSMFALDVIGQGYGFWQTVAALLLHLIPSFVLLAAALLAWRYELAGAAIFLLFGFWYIWEAREHPSWWPVISGPAFLVAVLYWTSWYYKNKTV